MRGHLRKRVAGRHLRILRRNRSYGKERVSYRKQAVKKIIVYEDSKLTTEFGDITRDVWTLDDLVYSAYVYKDSALTWDARYFDALRCVEKYFAYKTIGSFKRIKSHNYKWSFKNRRTYWSSSWHRFRRYWYLGDYLKYTSIDELLQTYDGADDDELTIGAEHADAELDAVSETHNHFRESVYRLHNRPGYFPRMFETTGFLRYICDEPGSMLGRGNAGRSSDNRAIKNHYSLRVAKYKNNYAYAIIARWARATMQKLVSRYRYELTLVDEPILLAPRMFNGSTYKHITLNRFFMDNLGNMFTYVYTYKTFIDRVATLGRQLSLKTFAFINQEEAPISIKLLESKIAEFNKKSDETLKMTKNKNKPAYCYYLDARVQWDVISQLESSPDYSSFDLLSIYNLYDLYLFMQCIEVYKLWSVLIYLSILK